MAWDQESYEELKAWVKPQLGSGYPASIYGKDVMHIDVFIGMLPGMIEKEQWEQAQAIKDAIREWINENLPEGEAPVPEDATLKLSPYVEREPCGYHISLGDPDDPSGLASGGSINGWG